MPQPAGRRGTVERPYSALNLRLILAAIGLGGSIVLAVLLFANDAILFGLLFVASAVVAAVDIFVIQARRRARQRSDPNGHSLFE